MTDDDLPEAVLVDAVFPLQGRHLPQDHRLALADALEAAAPWLRDLPGAGVHPVNLVPDSGEPALLSHRARLVLRLPRAQEAQLPSLAGRELDVAGHRLRLGTPHLRELLPHNTLYAHFVASTVDEGEGDEAAFLAAVNAELDTLGAACRRICGRRQHVRGEAGALLGFSLMLHGLGAADALRVLEAGVGPHRRLGAGVFVPHRSAAAVGT